MPAVNLSNRLNPNNIHYDRVLAAQYKRMSKPEKEALWAQDRLMQQRAQQARFLLFLLGGMLEIACKLDSVECSGARSRWAANRMSTTKYHAIYFQIFQLRQLPFLSSTRGPALRSCSY